VSSLCAKSILSCHWIRACFTSESQEKETFAQHKKENMSGCTTEATDADQQSSYFSSLPHTWNPFYSDEDYSQKENIQDCHQSSQEWMCQQVP